jgi:hypothetical protein
MSNPRRSCGRRNSMFNLALGGFAAAAMLAGFNVNTSRGAAISLLDQSDLEVRESTPELNRNTGTTATGPMTELAVRASGANNQVCVMRFDLAGAGITSASQLLGFADLQIRSRADGGFLNNVAGGVKIYGLRYDHPLNLTWNETTMYYRDAGTSVPNTAPHPQNQPLPGTPAAGAPVVPLYASATWGANTSDPNRTPGLLHQNAPYSANVDNINSTRYTANGTVYTNYLADLADDGIVQGTYTYQTYVNQPTYTQTAATGNWTDLVLSDLPLNTLNDTNPADTTLLGYLNFDSKAASARPAGTLFSFGTNAENSPINMGSSVYNANLLNLVAYLTNALNNGATQVTFLALGKITGDPGAITGSNMLFSSKDYDPAAVTGQTGGNAWQNRADPGGTGVWGPTLVVAPEPSGLALLALGAAGLLRRARRRD